MTDIPAQGRMDSDIASNEVNVEDRQYFRIPGYGQPTKGKNPLSSMIDDSHLPETSN